MPEPEGAQQRSSKHEHMSQWPQDTAGNAMSDQDELSNWMRDLAVAAKESVNNLHRVAEVAEDTEIASCLNRIAARREPLVVELDRAIWRMDALTSSPNADRESLRDLLTHFELFVHMTDVEGLLHRSEETEAKLSAAAGEASQIETLPSELADIAIRLKADADDARAEIASLSRQH